MGSAWLKSLDKIVQIKPNQVYLKTNEIAK